VSTTRRSWRAQRSLIERRLHEAGIESPAAEARWLVENASGYDGIEWMAIADQEPNARAQAQLDAMVDRCLRGEPLQYALGSWQFRGLDLLVDERVLIPRPETEWVVELALEEAERFGLRRGGRAAFDGRTDAVVADLGTGSGAIALALAAELPDVLVWATDSSRDALAVARANVAGSAVTRVRIAEGSWFSALPNTLRGELALAVANPPYIAEHEVPSLPAKVADFEPRDALVSGPTGLEAIEAVVREAPFWLAPTAGLVVEIAPHQADAASELARRIGFEAVAVRDDLAGRPRVLVARAPARR
jgi:release factor glutamine methyltransferase